VHLQGAVQAQLGESTIPLTMAGMATQTGFPDCEFSVSVVGELVAPDVLHLTYSGSDCRNQVEGSGDLHLVTQGAGN
jgi:hypothetical protein